MKQLLNTLYITTPDYYLSLDGETVKVINDGTTVGRFPLLNFESIVTHGYTGVSPKLLSVCMQRNIPLCFMSRTGRFLGRASGENRGNVLLRKEQYRISDDVRRSLRFGKQFVYAKVHNLKWIIERTIRDHPLQVDTKKLSAVSGHLSNNYNLIKEALTLEELRGIEGETAKLYFSCFNELILNQKDEFIFEGRSRRPPLDKVNALLSYLYTILAHDVASALEAVGLDPYVGFLHRDRPGRLSLALDLMEEFRGILVDRSVLTAINKLEINAKQLTKREDGAVVMDDDARKKILAIWQRRKQETMTHPFIKEKIPWGTAPYVQALLLARTLRGDLDDYPPFLYRI